MTWQDASFWELVLDIIALCLCGTAVMALVRQQAGASKAAVKDQDAFNDVLERLRREGLDGEAGMGFHLGTVREIASADLEEDRYHEVENLADLGLSAEDITRKIDIPKGEVELLLKLKRQSQAFQDEPPEKQAAVG